MTRAVLLTEIPSPYRIPLFNALAERLDLDVLFLHERDPRRAYRSHADEHGFRWHVLPGRELQVRGRWLVLNRGVLRALRQTRPDVVIVGGWNQPGYLLASAWARLHRVPLVLWVESTATDARSGRFEWAKRLLARAPDAFLVPGAASRAYLRDLAVSEKRIALAPNAVDPAIFGRAPSRRADGPCRVLAVGRLAPEKGLDVLLDAVTNLPVEVVIAGSGPEEQWLRARAPDNVRFVGQVDRDELPELYANADVLAMPSLSEPWGMVLNEAALAGLPLVSTDAAGAAHALIEDGVNGFRVPAGDATALREAIRKLADDPSFRRSAGKRSAEVGARFTPAAWADEVTALVTTLTAP